jgi:hypothetical protein
MPYRLKGVEEREAFPPSVWEVKTKGEEWQLSASSYPRQYQAYKPRELDHHAGYVIMASGPSGFCFKRGVDWRRFRLSWIGYIKKINWKEGEKPTSAASESKEPNTTE